jgi:hypothetical protein
MSADCALRRSPGRARVLGLRVVAIAVALSGFAACKAPGSGAGTPVARPLAIETFHNRLPSRAALLHPKHKYYGISVPGAPQSMQPIRTVANQTGKTPNLVEYYQDWTRPFDPTAARQACAAGVLPMLTWESLSWSDTVGGGAAVRASQPAYAPRRIASGAYDSYIRATAREIKALGCPIALRLDHEPNGNWYPWGMLTAGMNNQPAQYVAMWRHVWNIFHQVGARNVIWTWSPNFAYPHGPNALQPLYPGNKYVDVVGIDGYVRYARDHPATMFNDTLRILGRFASTKPWLLAETGVASRYQQGPRIAALLHWVATNPRLMGIVYLDAAKGTTNWSFDSSASALSAFRGGIAASAFGHAPPIGS